MSDYQYSIAEQRLLTHFLPEFSSISKFIFPSSMYKIAVEQAFIHYELLDPLYIMALKYCIVHINGGKYRGEELDKYIIKLIGEE